MTDLTEPHDEWRAWVEAACAALDVDSRDVDITRIHELTREVAHTVDRPLAPVAAYILGLAVGAARHRGDDVDAELLTGLIDRIPTST